MIARPGLLARLRRDLDLEDYLVLAAVVLLPWAFGGVEIWAYRSAALLLVGSAAVLVWKHGWGALGLGLRSPRTRWLLPALLLAGWALIQVVPLPPGAVRVLSPGAYKVYTESLPGYPDPAPADTILAIERMAIARVPEAGLEEPDESDGGATGRSSWMPLSLHAKATQERLLWYVALLLGFLVVRRRVADPERYGTYRGVLFAMFLALAVFALLQAATWNGKLYWVRPLLVSGARAFGPYVNPNHFAGVMELAVPWLAGYAWATFRQARSDTRASRFIFLVELAGIYVIAALAAASRSGVVLIGLTLTVVVVVGAQTRRSRWLIIGGAAVVWAAGAFVLMGTKLQERFGQYLEDAGAGLIVGNREITWASSLSMFGDFPVTGLGFGAFRELFPRYMPSGAAKFLYEAHNDYLEVMVEGGIVATILLLWLAWGFWSRVPAAVRSSSSNRISTSRLGLALGVASLTVHAFIDFNHQIPANALLFVTACAMLVPHRAVTPERETSKPGRAWTAVVLIAVLGFFGYRAATGTVAGVALARAVVLADRGEREAALSFYEKAAVGENRARALRRAAHQRVRLWRREAIANGEAQANPVWLADATDDLIDALWLTPAFWRNWSGLADVYERKERLWAKTLEPDADLGDSPAASAGVGRPGVITVGLLREALVRAPNWYRLHDELALIFWDLGLEAQALESVRASARALPVASKSRMDRYAELPPEFLAAFAEGSWDGLGHTPYLREADHLIALGRVEWRRENLGVAAGLLTAALEQGESGRPFAEASYYLGVVMLEAGRPEEARTHLRAAVGHPWLGTQARRHLRNLGEQMAEPGAPGPPEEVPESPEEEAN